MDAKIIGRRLYELRGDTPRDIMAKKLGISVSAISMYENGERIPRDAIKIKYAEICNTSVQEIFFNE